MHFTHIPQKLSYFDFFDTVHLVFGHLVLPLADDTTPAELLDGLLLTTSIAAIN